MKRISILILSWISFVSTNLVAGPVEEFCAQFAAGAEVRTYRGFPQPAFERNLYERAKKAGCISLLGEVFYPETKTLTEKDATAWLALATNPDSYYPAERNPTTASQNFHADIAFWCVTPDHKNQAYCLYSFATSQVQVTTTGKGVTVAMTFELEKRSREILLHYFEQEIKAEKANPARE